MTHYTNMLISVTYVTSVTPIKCVTMWHNVTLWPKKAEKIAKNAQICYLGNKIDETHCDTIWHFDKDVTPKVFKFSRPSNDGRRHGRVSYLLGHCEHFLTKQKVTLRPRARGQMKSVFSRSRRKIRMLLCRAVRCAMWFQQDERSSS
jgi:hypothetical protein